MTTNYKRLAVDADLPGVTTTVQQTVDFGQLDESQLRRCIRAVERGHTARGGYVAGLVRAAAKHTGLAPPIRIDTNYIYGIPTRYAPVFDDFIKLSNVRYQMQLANDPAKQRSPYWARRECSWYHHTHGSQLHVVGWDKDREAMAVEVRKCLKAAGYHEDLKALAKFIATRPKFEVTK